MLPVIQAISAPRKASAAAATASPTIATRHAPPIIGASPAASSPCP
ncbi:hypothetical protein ACIU1J_07050 [Azospirillum doebereinerae]